MAAKGPSEAEIQKAILQYLRVACGFLAWRNNSGAMAGEYKGKRRYVRFNTAVGGSDLFAVLPGGVFASVEIKRPGGKPTAKQAAWLASVARAGGVAFVAAGIDDVRRELRGRGYGVP